MPLSCLHVGPACVLHMPGELFIEYQLAAQKMHDDKLVCLAAYGDCGPGYIGTAISYTQGGYETGVVSRTPVPTSRGCSWRRFANCSNEEAGGRQRSACADELPWSFNDCPGDQTCTTHAWVG